MGGGSLDLAVSIIVSVRTSVEMDLFFSLVRISKTPPICPKSERAPTIILFVINLFLLLRLPLLTKRKPVKALTTPPQAGTSKEMVGATGLEPANPPPKNPNR